MKDILKELNRFLGKASLATYIGGGQEMDPQEPGFKDLEFKEGDWHYKDSYTGFFQSWGRETIWFKGKPFWAQLYGGGMVKEFHGDAEFAHKTFAFLKKAMSAGDKKEEFQPRGPKSFSDGDWKYTCTVKGDITSFQGSEKITLRGKTVFTHSFVGGLVVAV
jgi:hypothetical protein